MGWMGIEMGEIEIDGDGDAKGDMSHTHTTMSNISTISQSPPTSHTTHWSSCLLIFSIMLWSPKLAAPRMLVLAVDRSFLAPDLREDHPAAALDLAADALVFALDFAVDALVFAFDLAPDHLDLADVDLLLFGV